VRVAGGEGVQGSGRSWRVILAAAAIAVFAAPSLAQAPQKPPVDDSPRFEIRRFLFEGATLIPRERLEADTRVFVGPQKTFADVQRALEVVERAYSAAGWSAVQVVLPEQELERGEIRFQIIEAKIGRVIVEGNKFFDEANIRASVPSLAPGKAPNINAIARNLRVANESPAKQAQVLLRSGQEEATVDAVLRVVDEKPTKRSVTIDNTGSPTTGRLRVGLGYQNANTTGNDDVLSLQFVTAPYDDHMDESGRPDRYSILPNRRVTILGAGYRIPLYGAGDSLDFTVGYSNVNSGTIANLFSITGAGTILGARYTANLAKLGDYEHRLIFSADWRTYDNKGVRPVGSTVQLVPDVTVHPLGVTYAGAFRKQDSETGFTIGLSKNVSGGNDGTAVDFCKVGLRNNGLGNCASATYEIWRWSFNHNQAMPADFQLRFAMQGQETRDLLVPGELFGIGGADSVRGFLEREVADDTGHRWTVEVYTPDFGSKTGISGARMRGLVFLEQGHVTRNKPAPGDLHSQSIGSFGIGIRVSQGTNMAFRVDYAVVIDPGAGHTQGSSRVHASLSYIF
jgi:hemolysin activation/secretion protein